MLASSKADELSWEWPARQQGIFTYWLCRALEGGGDENGDGKLSFEEVYKWLRAQWQAQSREAQAQAIFDELEVEEGGPKRHPLESETFRALLEQPALLRAA